MKPFTRPTRRASARTSRRRGSSDVSTTSSSPPASGLSNAASIAPEASLEVTFCAVQRVRGRSFLLLCTRSDWRLYRLNGFSATRESCAPVQLLLDPEKDAARLSNVRFFHLFELRTAAASALAVGALFVSERSCPQLSSDDEDEDFVSATATEEDDGREDIAVLALDKQKLLHKLPPSPSLVLDIQTNATTAAVLCETRELFLYDLVTLQLQQTITTASPAMALGPRWLAYPGFAQGVDASQANRREQSLTSQGDSDSDFDDVPIEALVNGGMAVDSRDRSSPSYTAIDVAQNVASGLYYLSEVGRATIAPYLSSSPGKPSNGMHNHHALKSPSGRLNSGRSRKSSLNESASMHHQKTTSNDDTAVTASKKHPGWVVVLDLVTKRVLANFPCHSTALVNLSLDFSGLLLATNSTKGQNLHVYRLSPPLQSIVNKPGGAVAGHGTLHHQLVYKLQRGITHASIQDIAFSQDGKWINVTSAHGTSHLYALHPEGARISADTHANTVESAVESDADGLGPGFPLRQVNDFYADFRTLETRTQTQVLRIRHEFKIPTVSAVTPHKATAPVSFKARTTRSSSTSSSSSMSSTSPSSSSPPGPAFHSPPMTGSMRSSTIMESALDVSQALLSQLATSAIDFGHQHFENDTDVASRRRRLRQRLCCLFAPDGLKMLTCCDSVLKLYDMRVTALSQHKADHARAASDPKASDPKTKNSKSSLSSFGFEASVTELKAWELLASGRRKSESLSSAVEDHASLHNSSGDVSAKSELRTFAQRSLPLWAHPKVTFKAIDEDHPEGQILEVKRKGPNPSQDLSASTMAMAPEGYANGDEQLFVMEMDSYFGIGGSPVFDGHDGGRPVTPEVPPPLDLAASINMAMSSSLSETPPKPIPEVKNTICFRPIDQNSPHLSGVNGAGPTQKGKKKKGKNRRILTPPSSSATEVEVIEEGSSTGGLASLQFTMQDMYFGVPTEEASG